MTVLDSDIEQFCVASTLLSQIAHIIRGKLWMPGGRRCGMAQPFQRLIEAGGRQIAGLTDGECAEKAGVYRLRRLGGAFGQQGSSLPQLIRLIGSDFSAGGTTATFGIIGQYIKHPATEGFSRFGAGEHAEQMAAA